MRVKSPFSLFYLVENMSACAPARMLNRRGEKVEVKVKVEENTKECGYIRYEERSEQLKQRVRTETKGSQKRNVQFQGRGRKIKTEVKGWVNTG